MRVEHTLTVVWSFQKGNATLSAVCGERESMQRLFILLLAVLSSCSQNPSTPLTGSWQFTATLPVQGTVTLSPGQITQTGGTFTSTPMAFPGPPGCATTATVEGTITGNQVTFQFLEGDPHPTIVQTLDFSGTANLNASSMSGTFTTPSSGSCAAQGDSGPWSAVRVVR